MFFRIHMVCTVWLIWTSATAQFNATYGFVDVSASSGTIDPSQTPQVKGLKLGSFNAVNLSVNPTASGRFVFSGWPLGAANGVDDLNLFTGDLSGMHYYEVKLFVLPGYTLQLSSILFHVRRSGTGPRNYAIRGDRDNFQFNLSAQTGTNTNLTTIPGNIFFWKYDSLGTSSDQKGSMVLPGNDFSKISDSVTVRFFAWNSEAPAGSFSIDNVTFSGLVIEENPLGIIQPDCRIICGEGYWQVTDLDGQVLVSAWTIKQEDLLQYLPPGLYILRSGDGSRKKILKTD